MMTISNAPGKLQVKPHHYAIHTRGYHLHDIEGRGGINPMIAIFGLIHVSLVNRDEVDGSRPAGRLGKMWGAGLVARMSDASS